MDRLVPKRINFGGNAPITEALVDIRAEMGEHVEPDALRGLVDGIAGAYPEVRTQTEWAGQIKLGSDSAPAATTAKHAVRGFLCSNPDGTQVVQARRDGFTFSRLAPYASWQHLRDEARRLWEEYVRVAAPDRVSRLAVRNVNGIGLPEEHVRLQEWFKLYPTSPAELGSMADFLVRLVYRHPQNRDYIALVTLGTLSPQNSQFKRGALLDIDVWTEVDQPADGRQVWEILEDLHEFKNDVFFGSITEKTEEWLHGGHAKPS
jgi:uncharacterized protein (TIGR04255 family)